MHSNSIFFYVGLFLLLLASGCSSADQTDPSEAGSPRTPVTVTTAKDTTLSEYVESSAISAYLEKSYVKANLNGYLEKTNVRVGRQVYSGELLFSLVTKEARAIGNTINKLDSGFKFSGISKIRSREAGVITAVNHQTGDYVQDGEALASISNRSSLVFLLDLPYELHAIIKSNKNVQLMLPDGTIVPGALSGTMPAVDSLAQTQRYIVEVSSNKEIPEGLVARVRLTKTQHSRAQVLPKSSVLSNDTEDHFWIMKLINDSTAVKIIVKKGLENASEIEIRSPKLSASDRIITSGNYGLADTALVKIQSRP